MNNNQQEMIKYPRLLDNKPCGQDLFEGKSHETIARNIAKLIKNGESKVIGIDGGWGSGKSNMVKLITNTLDPKIYHFFIYDAWGHQTDFQRRSILENLTGFLVDEAKILGKNKWDAKLLQLLSRKRSVGSKIVKEMSAIAKVGSVIALVMPLLLIINSFINNDIGKIVYWAAILIVSLICLYFLQLKNMMKYGQSTKFSNIVNELFLSYQDYTNEKGRNNIEQLMKYETIYDEEPSSRDFKNWMTDIDKDINGNTLIIVFDNMDRLPKEKVQELWSAIHSFFAEKEYSNIKVIVPFDRSHIKNAFKNEDSQKDGVCYGDDYINKTFDVIYRVSPPILSDWKTYFTNRWKEAFGVELEHNSRITQIYDLLSGNPAPREIIAFINEFVTIKQVSDTSIPDEYIALFIFGKSTITSDSKEILNPTYLGAIEFLYKDDVDLPKYISALYYQLPPEKALDIIYTENLKKALDNYNIDQIKYIQKLPNLFFNLLENAITKISNYSNAILALDKCFTTEDPQKELMIWDCIYENAKHQFSEKALQEYHKVLLKKISKKEELIKSLTSSFSNHQEFDVIDYYNSIRQLSEVENIDTFNYLQEKKVEPSEFIRFVEVSKNDYLQYRITCESTEINKYLSGLDIDHLRNLTAIPYIKNDFDMSSYRVYLDSIIDGSLNNKETIRIIYERLKELERPIKKVLPDLQIQTHFNSTKSSDEFYYDLICMRISRLNSFQQNLRASFTNILNTSDDNTVEKVAERIEYYMDYGTILLNLQKMNSPLYNEVAKRLTTHKYCESEMNVSEVLQNYKAIKDVLGIDKNIIIERFNGWASEAKKVITCENVNLIPIDFFKDIVGQSDMLSLHCIKVAKDHLTLKTKEEWKQSILADKAYDYELLMIIKPNIQNCFDAFKEIIIEKAKGQSESFTKEKCNSLIELAKENGRELLSAFNSVRDCFCGGMSSMTNELFDFYGEWLLQYAKLEEIPSSLRTIFTSSVLDVKEYVQIILKHKEKMIIIVEKAGDENKDFKDKIKSLLQSDYYKNDKEFESFAKSIGVEKTTMLDSIKEIFTSNN